MLRCCMVRLGGAVGRKKSAASTASKTRSATAKATRAASSKRGAAAASSTSSAAAGASSDGSATQRVTNLPAAREKQMLRAAERMQQRDLSGDVPVASFVFEILKAHPSVREMALRERMDFIMKRWDKLPVRRRNEYINDPLKGIL